MHCARDSVIPTTAGTRNPVAATAGPVSANVNASDATMASDLTICFVLGIRVQPAPKAGDGPARQGVRVKGGAASEEGENGFSIDAQAHQPCCSVDRFYCFCRYEISLL